jgi:hypothetical protein
VTSWKLLRIPSNRISTSSYCNQLYLCISKLWVPIVNLHLLIGKGKGRPITGHEGPEWE